MDTSRDVTFSGAQAPWRSGRVNAPWRRSGRPARSGSSFLRPRRSDGSSGAAGCGGAVRAAAAAVHHREPARRGRQRRQRGRRAVRAGRLHAVGRHASALMRSTSSSMPKTGFDAQKDFEPIAMIGSGPIVLIVHAAWDVKSVADLVARAKKSPGELVYASAGAGDFQPVGDGAVQVAGRGRYPRRFLSWRWGRP